MGKTILIVEDEKKMRELLHDYLRYEGFNTLDAADGQEAVEMLEREHIDLVILDIMMPRMDGFAACRAIRSKSEVLILMLTARAEEYDELQGYGLGADDYMTKPFRPKVLMAKIHAMLRRLDNRQECALQLGGLCVDPDGQEVSVDGRTISLTRKEYDLLDYLVRNRNIALSRDQILEHVWGFDYEGDARTVDTHIKRLRHKLEHRADLIVTVKGFGYKLQVRA